MVKLESFNNFVTYIINGFIYGFLVGLKDGCLSFKIVIYDPASEYVLKFVQRFLYKETSASRSRSQKILTSRRDLSKEISLKYHVLIDIGQCSGFNVFIYLLSFVATQVILYLTNQENDTNSWHKFAVTSIINCSWVFPTIIILKLANLFWLEDIAYNSYRQRHGNPQGSFSLALIGKQVSDLVFSTYIEFLLYLQICLVDYCLVRLVPFQLSNIISLCHFSLLYSFYSFEYLWGFKGMNLQKKISNLETHWPYFLGFGLPLSALSILFESYLLNGMIFSALYPVFIMGAINAPQLNTKQRGPRLKVFGLVVWLANKSEFLFSMIYNSVIIRRRIYR